MRRKLNRAVGGGNQSSEHSFTHISETYKVEKKITLSNFTTLLYPYCHSIPLVFLLSHTGQKIIKKTPDRSIKDKTIGPSVDESGGTTDTRAGARPSYDDRQR